MIKIGIDVMGGDYAPENTILGALEAYHQLKERATLVLLGKKDLITGMAEDKGFDPGNFIIYDTRESIGMGDHPVNSFRTNIDSSMVVGFNLLKEKKIDVFASAGNTGAMLTGSTLTQPMIEGVTRPCISVNIPQTDGTEAILLDVGFNSDCNPEQLLQFAILGMVYAKIGMKRAEPRVALLNIGEEPQKGSLLTKESYKLLSRSENINFIGNIEADSIFSGKCDIIVTDGFTGNVILKEIEGMFTALSSMNIKNKYLDRFNYELYGGTPVLGIDSNVIIGHGASSPKAITSMIMQALSNVENNLTGKMKQQLYHEFKRTKT